MRAAALLLAALLLPAGAAAQTSVGVRVGDHPAHGRVVFDWPAAPPYAAEESDGRLVLRFTAPGGFALGTLPRPPRNVRGIAAEGEAVTISVAPGARVRHFRLGSRVVVDVLDPAAPAPARAAVGEPTPPRPAPPTREAARRAAPPAAPQARSAPQGPAAPQQQQAAPAVAPQPAPPAPAATPPSTPEPPAPPRGVPVQAVPGGFVIPAAADVGAALFRRGETWLLVFDAPLTLDPAALPGAETSVGPRAAVLRLPAEAIGEPALTRRPEGWRLEAGTAAPVLRSIRAELDPGPPPRLLLRAAHPAETVAVLDPETGGTLLVGTLREGGEATPLGRRASAFEVLPTRLGAALLPRADTVSLRALANGFAANPGTGAALALGPEPDVATQAAAMSRLFDLPAEPLAALVQRERNAALAVAAAPPLGRGQPRLRNAEALLALGLGAEAQTMAALAMREDPRAAADPAAQALHGAAALLAGRLGEADGLNAPRLPPSDEAALWQGLLAAARGEAGAPRIAQGLPLLRAWPEPLRARLAPLAAEALADAGDAATARRLMRGQEEEPTFALARARLLEAEDKAEEALAAYDAVGQGRDRRARAVAMRRAAELRLATGALDAAGAAAAMEAVLAAWRGDARERDARIRLAALRSQAGDPRGAFEALRETAATFPDGAAALRPPMAEALLGAIVQEPPVAAVALFDAHHALLPPGEATDRALIALAERLAALDLVARARAVLTQRLARLEPGESRARLGLTLAGLALGSGDAAGARAALADTGAGSLPDALRRERLLAEARALARLGDHDRAVAAFRAAGPEAGAELAELLAARQDWAGAATALIEHLAAAVPPPPAELDAGARRLISRAAALLALAGDEAGLAALRAAEGGRMEGGDFAEAFSLVTAGPLGGIRDLGRLSGELDLARALPGRLESFRGAAAPAR